MIVDKIRRYVWLLDTIYRAGERGITFDEINEKWQRYDLLSEGRTYPKRTFEQHKEEIQAWNEEQLRRNLHIQNNYS